MQKPYRFVHTNLQTFERAISSEFEGGLPMQDLQGATSGSTSALQTIAPSYTIGADFLQGFQKCAFFVEILQKLKADNHQR